ncbi:MAG TPA: DUF3644 domain-containing protein, partial [Terracidiphilus sp.]|nr:DUF3644 domain-containing protein [Terracidiphilus sp.]
MPRLKNEVAVHLEKARDSAFLAVETYNRPRTSFRSGGYIVLMCIAWTALFHAIFFKRGVKPFYRKRRNRRHFEVVDGDKKAWELSQCLAACGATGHFPTWCAPNFDEWTSIQMRMVGTWTGLSRALGPVKVDE